MEFPVGKLVGKPSIQVTEHILAPIPVGAIYLSTTYPTIVTSFWSQFVLFRHGLVTILVTTLGSKVDQSAAALLPASGEVDPTRIGLGREGPVRVTHLRGNPLRALAGLE